MSPRNQRFQNEMITRLARLLIRLLNFGYHGQPFHKSMFIPLLVLLHLLKGSHMN